MFVPTDSVQIATPKDHTRIHYRKFHNIFLYVTERCQLRCGHCYMGDRLERGLQLTYERATQIIEQCRRLGAEYLTLLGGEPTLHPDLPKMVQYAVDLGFQQVMIDSNGLLVNRIKKIPSELLHYITVSLDGATAESHERVRGKGTFEKTTKAIQELVNSGYRVRINCTVFQFNIHEAPELLSFADRVGVLLVNFHTFSEEGYGAANSAWSLTPHDWIAFYESLEKIKHNYSTSIWYPPTWAKLDRVKDYADQGFRGCLGCSLDRLSIFPDGRCYVCSVMFDEAFHFALLTEDGLVLNRHRNEFEMFTKAALQADEPWLTGCPAEQILEYSGKKATPSDLIAVCRCWKSQV